MHVVHIIAGLNIGGANKMLLKLLSGFDDSRFNSSVIVLMNKGSLGLSIEELEIKVYEIGMRQGKPTLGSLVRISKVLKQLRPDLVQGWMYHANTAAFLSNFISKEKVPVLWNIRHTPYRLKDEGLLTRILIILGASLSSSPQKIIYNSKVSAQWHQQIGYDPARTIIIPNGFDTNRFKPDPLARSNVRQSLEIDEQTPLIGIIARYHPMKDHETLLKAAAQFIQIHPNTHYLLAGKGVDTQNPELTGMISGLGISEQVHLYGEIHDVENILPSLDIHTLSSAWGEGFPNIIGEAMSCGVPCVVTDIGDSSQIVGDTGITVPSRDPSALVTAWAEILALSPSDLLAKKNAARRRIVDNYALLKITEQYQQLYLDVVK